MSSLELDIGGGADDEDGVELDLSVADAVDDGLSVGGQGSSSRESKVAGSSDGGKCGSCRGLGLSQSREEDHVLGNSGDGSSVGGDLGLESGDLSSQSSGEGLSLADEL